LTTFCAFNLIEDRVPLLDYLSMALDRIECVEVFAADGLGAGIRPLAVLACASGGAVRLKQRRVLRGGPAKAGEPRSLSHFAGDRKKIGCIP
jgi:hypothetical protein